MPHYQGIQRKALHAGFLPDSFTRSLYRLSPYKGCAHGCRYCDGRAEKYFVKGDFEQDIEVRSQLPELLAKELPKLRESGMVAFGSGVTDPYQPCEGIEELTKRCSKELLAFSLTGSIPPEKVKEKQAPPASIQELFPFAESEKRPESKVRLSALVMTKSALALRDLPTWSAFNATNGFVLVVSLTSLDEGIRRVMEPGASSFSSRIEMLKAYKNAGCITGVLAMPLLPGISDNIDSLSRLYAACLEAQVDFIMPGGLTLRPGRQKELYLSTVQNSFNKVYTETLSIFSENRSSGRPNALGHRVLADTVAAVRESFSIPWLLPYKAYSKLMPQHDSLRLLLQDMLLLYSDRGIDTSSLERSAQRYDLWLKEIRTSFRRKRSLQPGWLEDRFQAAVHSDELPSVLDNQRLSSMVLAICREAASFSYIKLRLE